MADLVPLYMLLAFVLVAGIIAVETHDLLSSVLCMGAVGFGLSLAEMVLKAPDLVLAGVVVEVFALVLLIRIVITRQEAPEEFIENTPTVALTGGIILSIVIGMLLCFQAASFTAFGEPLMDMGQAYLEEGVVQGVQNQVTAVLLDYRAYDTLGEVTVIFTAIMGCYALLRREGEKDSEGNDANS